MSVLAIDAGTTGVTALVVSAHGQVVAGDSQEVARHLPRPGWIELAPEDIWQATLRAVREVLTKVDASELTSIGITNQRETIVLWDRETLGSPRRAILGQDRRTVDVCARLRDAGHEERVSRLTGLRLDPQFSGTKLAWLAEHEPHTWALVESGRYAVGTVDSYLIARMTRGTWHVTDVSNASRTLLFDLENGEWSDELCRLFDVPRDALPDLVPSWGEIAPSEPSVFLGLSIPIAGVAGGQQAALFGQTCFEEGDSQCSYGTGSFILTNTGTSVQRSEAGLLSTAAWRSPDGVLTYASEGAIFVPALTGPGAPYCDTHPRGTIIGDTRGTTSAHLVRATLEAIAFEVREVLEAMPRLASLRVDGEAAANDVLCQVQADQIGLPVERSTILETAALGAAFLAGLGTGVWDSAHALRETWSLDRRFDPESDRAGADETYARWQDSVGHSKRRSG